LQQLQTNYNAVNEQKQQAVNKWMQTKDTATATQLKTLNAKSESIRNNFKGILKQEAIGGDANDTNYVFLRFVVDYLPVGLVGLLIAVIFLAAWGSIAAALNSLASSTVIDMHKRFSKKECTDKEDYKTSKWYTFAWGVFCVITAMFATNMGSLIEAVNVLGSVFYGVILGIFLVAFYFKRIKAHAIFYSAVIIQVGIFILFWFSSIGFLWMNLIGAAGVVLLALLLQLLRGKETTTV
jgi:solute:Na+ symporter, SSS family